MDSFLQNINNNYSGVLTLATSILMVIITTIYVIYTKKQADYAKKSVDAVLTQIKTEKQPCIVPSIIDSQGVAYNATDYTRMQISFEISLDNCGDSPATNVFTFAFIELQNKRNKEGEKVLLLGSLLPDVIHAIMKEQSEKTTLLFETREIKLLLEDLSICMENNWKRLKSNPYQNHFHGSNIIIKSFYRNTMGQWYVSSLVKEIAWFEFVPAKKRKTNNINETTIPPLEIEEGDNYKAILVSDKFAPFSYHMTDEDTVKKYIEKCGDDNSLIEDLINGFD